MELQRILDQEDQFSTARMLLALEQYREGRTSLEQAAELAGVSVSEKQLSRLFGLPWAQVEEVPEAIPDGPVYRFARPDRDSLGIGVLRKY